MSPRYLVQPFLALESGPAGNHAFGADHINKPYFGVFIRF